ncbi:MAG: hypothetical protein ACP5FT_01520 [Acidilobus sp.]
MKVEIYFHPSCATSHEVIVGLRRAGLLSSVRLISLERGADAISLGVWSVPWIVIDGRPSITDPTTSDEVISVLRGGRPSVDDPVEAFMTAVLHSSFATAVTILHASVSGVADVNFASAAVRAPLTGLDPYQVVNLVSGQGKRLFAEWRDRLRRAAAVSFVRELYWASNGEITPEEVAGAASPAAVGAWLIAKGSVGRVALPASPKGSAKEDAEWISGFVRKAARGLLEKVKEEQEGVYGDQYYLEALREAGVNIPP